VLTTSHSCIITVALKVLQLLVVSRIRRKGGVERREEEKERVISVRVLAKQF
jgi:hypothetical protein